MPAPHLSTALSGPVLDLERCILDAMPSIEHWFRNQWQKHAPPFYCSVDLRNGGFKLAPWKRRKSCWKKARSPRARLVNKRNKISFSPNFALG
jgi:hypothetical protein